MTRPTIIVVLGLAVWIGEPPRQVSAEPPERAREERFEAEVRPVLVETCFPCHGGKKTGGGLRVGTRDELVRGGDSGPAIVPNQPEQSLLIRAIEHGDDALKMPPKKKLPGSTIAAFTRWVKEGAPWPDSARPVQTQRAAAPSRHWAFEPVKAVQPPPDPTGWSVHPIDRFIAARHRAAGIRPVADANCRTLIRRVSFDLIGLPPAPEEIADFVADDRPDAFARVVERLLASPQYGERWGRHWMDVAHYADTAGDNADYPVPELARYRDYVIDSLNKDLPFDQFVREQLAGDILAGQAGAGAAAAPIVATGFLALSRRYATGPYELWHLTLEDAIETTGRAFLGLTLRCARCHDHKYDPVTQRDYYALYGVFASTKFPYAGSEEFQSKGFPRQNFVPTAAAGEVAARVRARDDRLRSLEREIAELERTRTGTKPLQPTKVDPARLASLRKERDRLRRAGLPVDLPCAYAVSEGPFQDSAVQRGGDPGRPGPVVPRGVPRLGFLTGASPPAVAAGASGRRELAEWITRPDHPLTARVIANRVWQHHFGRGIVATPSNFGVRGEPPSHPELLDWLAARLVASGWSIKDLHRQILLSRTYRLASESDEQSAGVDPGNQWLWRFDRRRLDAESIRDAMLAVSGQLDRRRPLAHPFPAIEDWHWTQHNAFKAIYPSDQRSVFLMTQRLVKHPFLAIFDGPDTNTSTDVRPRSTVPLQALYLMNNSFVQDQSAALARRLLSQRCDVPGRIERAWELAWGRPPLPRENQQASGYLATYAAAAAASGTSKDRQELEAWTSLARILLTANEFLYID